MAGIGDHDPGIGDQDPGLADQNPGIGDQDRPESAIRMGRNTQWLHTHLGLYGDYRMRHAPRQKALPA